jgi:hypothetical protein
MSLCFKMKPYTYMCLFRSPLLSKSHRCCANWKQMDKRPMFPCYKNEFYLVYVCLPRSPQMFKSRGHCGNIKDAEKLAIFLQPKDLTTLHMCLSLSRPNIQNTVTVQKQTTEESYHFSLPFKIQHYYTHVYPSAHYNDCPQHLRWLIRENTHPYYYAVLPEMLYVLPKCRGLLVCSLSTKTTYNTLMLLSLFSA